MQYPVNFFSAIHFHITGRHKWVPNRIAKTYSITKIFDLAKKRNKSTYKFIIPAKTKSKAVELPVFSMFTIIMLAYWCFPIQKRTNTALSNLRALRVGPRRSSIFIEKLSRYYLGKYSKVSRWIWDSACLLSVSAQLLGLRLWHLQIRYRMRPAGKTYL